MVRLSKIILAALTGVLVLGLAVPIAQAEEKPIVPTIEKKVMDTDGWANSTVSSSNTANWQVTVTMPGEIESISSFPVVIRDTLPSGSELDLSSLAVAIDSKPIEFKAEITYTSLCQ